MEVEQTADTAPVQDTAPETTVETQDIGQLANTSTEEVSVNTEQETASEFSLPDEYKEKPWASKIKSSEDVYKQLDNLNSLVGKKTITPIDYETASSEEIAEHHSKLAPESADQYNFGEGADPEFSKAVGETFQKLGITKYQADGLSAKVNEIAKGIVEKQNEVKTDADSYLTMMKESFGEDYEAAAGIVEKTLKVHANDDDKAIFDAVDNTTRAAVDRTVHSLVKQYEERINKVLKEHGIEESSAQVEAVKGQNTGVDVDGLRKDLRSKIRAMDDGSQPYTASEKQALVNKLNDTYR